MLAPKRVLHRKVQRGSMKGQAKGNTTLHHGSYGIQAQEGNTLSGRKTIYNTQKYAYAQQLSGGSFCHAKAYSNSVSVSGEGCASDYNSFQGLMSAGVATKNTESCYC